MYDQPTPVNLLKTVAIHRNLISGHIKLPNLENQIARYSSGYYGEVAIAYHLKYILDNAPKLKLCNLRIQVNNVYIEIDTLLFCNKFLLILQVKNLTGNVTIDHQVGTMIQEVRGERVGYQDPILQVEKHAKLLSHWLRKQGFHIPIKTLVVFTNKNVVIQGHNQPLDKRIISGYKLSHVYEQLQTEFKDQPVIENAYDIYAKLISENQIYNIDMLNELDLQADDFVPGAICSYCQNKSMTYERGGLSCTLCYGRTDIEEAIKDYYLIFGPTITSEQLASWLGITPHTARRNLAKMNLKSVNDGQKYKTYTLDYSYEHDFNYLLEYNKNVFIKNR